MKKLICILLALIMVLSMAACSKSAEPAADSTSTNGNTPAASDTEKTETPAKTDEVVELRFMDVIPSPAREATFQQLVAEFNAQNPDIKVVYESVPWDEAHNKLITQGSAGAMPDIFVMHRQWNAEFTSAGWVLPLDDYIANWEGYDNLIPYAQNVLMDYDQKNIYGYTFGIPDGLSTHAMFVRSDWLEEAGLTVDDLSTWDGIFAAAEKMTDTSKNRYGFAFRGARMGSEQMGMYILAQLGGKLYEDDGTCRINTPEGLEAFKRYCSLYVDGYSPADSINWGYAEMVQGFTSGLSGILNQTSEVVATCNESMEDGTWTVIPFPKAADGYLYSKADSWFYAIGSSTEHPEEAWRFIEFMLKPESNLTYCETNLYIPVTKGAENDPRFTEGGMSGFVKSMNDEMFIREPFYGYFPELVEFMESVYDVEMQKYLLGQQTAEQSVENISNYLTEAQQRYMAENPDSPMPCAVRVDGTEVH